MSKKIAVVLGTRPEIIKMSPVIRELARQKINHYTIHSGQHYSYGLDKVFFEQLKLPKPRYKLEVGSASPGKQTGLIITGTERIFQRNRPDIVLVQGDTNTVLGATIAACKTGISVGHIEAGLRSYDKSMPEELNRILVDHSSDYLFAPTPESRDILQGESIPRKKIFVTGNTIVDAVIQNTTHAKPGPTAGMKNYILVSLHRQENVDNPARFARIAKSLGMVSQKFQMPVIYPIHPRSKKMAKKFGINLDKVKVIPAVDYFTFLGMQKGASLIMTDSGGVQEEACILGIPCITLRDNTERPETISVGSNMIAGTIPEKILKCAGTMMRNNKKWKSPFGSGDAARRIIDILQAK